MALKHEKYVNFINKYKSLRELWDITHENYKNKNNKKKAYKQLLKEYQNIYKNASLNIMKYRISNMRNSYRRELEKKIESEKSGADDLYEPQIWYFSLFDFLRDIETPELSFNSLACITSDDESTMSSSQNAKRKRTSATDEKNKLIETINDYFENKAAKEPDDADCLGKSWAWSYRKISPEQKALAKIGCDIILYLGQSGKLTPSIVPSLLQISISNEAP